MAQRTADREATPFSTDSAAELPVGIQLSWRLRALIATGQLAAGEKLPSFRRLAEWAGVNVNTVRAVYASLEEAGLVVSRQGRGTFVAEGIDAAPELEEIATDALRRVRDAGLSPRDLIVVATACASMPDADEDEVAEEPIHGDLPDLAEESEAIEVRHELRRQIARLEVELASYTRDLPADMPTGWHLAEAHIADVEELERTRDTLIGQLSEAQRAAELRARREDKARAKRKAMLGTAEPERPAPLDHGPLGKAMSWWRTKS